MGPGWTLAHPQYVQVAGPGIEPGAPALWEPVGHLPRLQYVSDQGESRTPKPEGHDVLSVARLPIAPLGHQRPVRELNPAFPA